MTGRDRLAHAIEKARLRRVTGADLAHEEPRPKRLCRRCGVYDASTGGKRGHPGWPSIEERPSHGKDETVGTPPATPDGSTKASSVRLGSEAREEQRGGGEE